MLILKTGWAAARTGPQPSSTPHWPVLPLQSRNKKPHCLEGWEGRMPLLWHFQQEQRCAAVSLGNTHKTPALRNASGMDASLPAGHCSFSPGPGSQPSPAQPSSSSATVPLLNTRHRIPAWSVPVSTAGISLPHQTRNCWAHLGQQNKLGSAEPWPRLDWELPLPSSEESPAAQCKGHSAHTLMLQKSASPLLISSDWLSH